MLVYLFKKRKNHISIYPELLNQSMFFEILQININKIKIIFLLSNNALLKEK